MSKARGKKIRKPQGSERERKASLYSGEGLADTKGTHGKLTESHKRLLFRILDLGWI